MMMSFTWDLVFWDFIKHLNEVRFSTCSFYLRMRNNNYSFRLLVFRLISHKLVRESWQAKFLVNLLHAKFSVRPIMQSLQFVTCLCWNYFSIPLIIMSNSQVKEQLVPILRDYDMKQQVNIVFHDMRPLVYCVLLVNFYSPDYVYKFRLENRTVMNQLMHA